MINSMCEIAVSFPQVKLSVVVPLGTPLGTTDGAKHGSDCPFLPHLAAALTSPPRNESSEPVVSVISANVHPAGKITSNPLSGSPVTLALRKSRMLEGTFGSQSSFS